MVQLVLQHCLPVLGLDLFLVRVLLEPGWQVLSVWALSVDGRELPSVVLRLRPALPLHDLGLGSHEVQALPIEPLGQPVALLGLSLLGSPSVTLVSPEGKVL